MAPDKAPSTRVSYAILFILFMLNVLNLIDRTMINVAMEPIKLELGLTDGQLGMIQSLQLLGIGLLAIPGGMLLDRWGRKKTVSLMSVSWSVATLWTAGAGSSLSLSASRFGMGAGQAGFGPSGAAWLSMLFPKKKLAFINALFQMGGAVGGITGMILGGYLITKYGDWRLPFYIFGGLGVVFGIAALFMPDVRVAADDQEKGGIWEGFKEIVSIPSFKWAAIAVGCPNGLSFAFGAWSVPLMMRAYGIDTATAGLVGGVAGMTAIVSPMIVGIIADRLQIKHPTARPAVTMVMNILVAIFGAIMLWSCGAVSLGVFIGIYAVYCFFCSFMSASQVMNFEITPARLRGTSSATQTFIFFAVFSSWGAWVMGAISDVVNGKAAAAATAAGASAAEVTAIANGAYGIQVAGFCMLSLLIIGAFASWRCMKSYVADVQKASADSGTPIASA